MGKKILGLDLGTNSIGWALIEMDNDNARGKIMGMGSRIIPMSQDVLGKFDAGQSISQTAERTSFRGIRRLRERNLLRRERLHRILNILNFLPPHYAQEIDFSKRPGQFFAGKEPKLSYRKNNKGEYEFIFKNSFEEMIAEFRQYQPDLFYKKNSGDESKIPYDWTIYYLRKKALVEKIEKEELAWLILNFNQKRGYYQLRGEEEEVVEGKEKNYEVIKVAEVVDSGERIKGKNIILYDVFFENGWKYDKQIAKPEDWISKTKEFIVTTSVNSSGEIKRTFKSVDSEQDWIAIKKKTEQDVASSNKTVGEYIYSTLLNKPNQKIRGKLIRTIERKFYKEELSKILQKQKEFHPELTDKSKYKRCLDELYKHNRWHKNNVIGRDFTYLFNDDVIFYQRPLKSKKSLISNCSLETHEFKDKSGNVVKSYIKCMPKSHPLYQEFRLLQWLKNLKILFKNDKGEIDITESLLSTDTQKMNLYNWLNDKTEIDQVNLLKYHGFNLEGELKSLISEAEYITYKHDRTLTLDSYFRWNYVQDKKYPMNETRGEIIKRLNKTKIDTSFLTSEAEVRLWHLLYSVTDKAEIEKGLTKFADKYKLQGDFVATFRKFPQIDKDYGAFSEKAVKKLLTLMRFGNCWSLDQIEQKTILRIEKIISAEYDEKIRNRVREKSYHLSNISDFKDLPLWLASYIIYDRHSELGEITNWMKPQDICLLKQHSLRNPIVEQIINETLLVTKDIWVRYGNGEQNFFDEIHVELGREMKNPANERARMTKQITENENTNYRIKSLLLELSQDGSIENVRPYSPMQQEILKIYEEGVYLSEKDEAEKEEIEKIRKKNQPTTSELKRYKLWLEQGYRSPYTGLIIPLSKLFTPAYEIEHIIPQSRYFDDSLCNKIICEAEVNKVKDNQLAYEFIKNNQGLKVDIGKNKFVQILDLTAYETIVKHMYGSNKSKFTKLMLEEIPEAFIQRQLNDTRYVSKVIKSLLSNLVRQEGESEEISKNLVPTNGNITSRLKQDWGLNDVWNDLITPRFERLNKMTGTLDFGKINENTGKFLPQVPFELSKGFTKKRIDHRHHAVDALVVACTTRNHVNYLNNEAASENRKSNRFDLRNKLRHLEEYTDSSGKKRIIAKDFIKPWNTFTQEAKEALQLIVTSFKTNNRVVNKTVNRYQKWEIQTDGSLLKVIKKQEKGENWAIRKPLHKDTVSGLVNLHLTKEVGISQALEKPEAIVNKNLRRKISELVKEGGDKKKINAFFKEHNYMFESEDISRVKVYYYTNDHEGTRVTATREKLDTSFNEKKIESITDTGIQKILLRHLENYRDRMDHNGKPLPPEVLAFSPEGLEELNQNIIILNNGKPHAPIIKVRTYETLGNKFTIGVTSNKCSKYVEAAKGTNLFFAIYADEYGQRNYETIPLNIAIERQKQGLNPVPEQDKSGNNLIFYLSPNDLVYVPAADEVVDMSSVDFTNLSKEQSNRVYKFVSSSGKQSFFIYHNVADSIYNKFEFSALNKMEKSIDDIMIKSVCRKICVDRIGKIILL